MTLVSRYLPLVLAGILSTPWQALPARAQPATPGEPISPAPRLAGFEVMGSIDPPGRVESYVASIARPESYFVEAGDADRIGAPISTVPRLEEALARIGYSAIIETQRRTDGAVNLRISLRAYDRIRHIFVQGNGLMRQEDILRRLSFRPGQPLPLVGPNRDAFVDRERSNVLEYLRSQGFLEARVDVELDSGTSVPSPVNVIVKIRKGPGFPVGPVSVKGNKALPTDEIVDEVRHTEWLPPWGPSPFRLSILREDLTSLAERYRELGYARARLTYNHEVDRAAKNIRLQIDVSEHKRVEVAFVGNRRFSDSNLKDRLTLFTRGAYDNYELDASAEAIAQYHRERGHMFVRVSWQRERLSADADKVTFSVVEGPVLKVRKVEFVGNRTLPSGELAGVVNVKVFPFLGAIGLGEGGFAGFRQLDLDVDNLLVYYREQGFPSVQVRAEIAPGGSQWHSIERRDAIETDPIWHAARAIFVRFLIDEGAREMVREIRFERTDGLGPIPRTVVGDPLRLGLVREDGERLKRILGDEGFPNASVEPLLTRDGANVIVTWQVTMGQKVQVGPIFVRGNYHTREKTVLLWIPLRTGSPLTTTNLERAQRNLALIQLFNNASPITFPIQDAERPEAPMLIEVEERHDHWGVIRVGGGASTEQKDPDSTFPLGVYASVGYVHKNLFGRGWTFDTQGAIGNSLTRATSNFLDPRFFSTLFRLEVAASYLRQATVRLGDIRSGAGSIGFSREMYPGVNASARYNFRDTTRTEFLIRGAGPDEQQQTVPLGTTVGSFSFGLEWLRLDNPLVPTRGFRLSSEIEWAHPAFSFAWGEDRFIKLNAQSIVMVPLLSWLGVRHSVRYDQGFPLGGATLLPKVERYFAGGDTTIRGFELDRARTEVIRSPIAPGIDGVQFRPAGGSLRVLHNVDFQFPILRPWYGAVFIDSGLLVDSWNGIDASSFRHGAGFSPLLLKLPIGDISFSWAWPLDPQIGDSRIGRWHFNVGLMF